MPNLAWRALLSVSPVPRRPPPSAGPIKTQGSQVWPGAFKADHDASKPDMDGDFGHFQISDFRFPIQISDFQFWI